LQDKKKKRNSLGEKRSLRGKAERCPEGTTDVPDPFMRKEGGGDGAGKGLGKGKLCKGFCSKTTSLEKKKKGKRGPERGHTIRAEKIRRAMMTKERKVPP